MNDFPLLPCYHPTTVFVVDDNAAFLSNLMLQLDSGMAFRLFDKPEAALAILSDAGEMPVGHFFSRYRDTGDLPMNHHVIDVDLNRVHRAVYDEQRFAEVSVVVVDYDMPSMNGVEFCKRIGNRAVRKILLTGKADEKLAVKAFNEGAIDRFIRKQDADAIEALSCAILELQHAYFGRNERMLADALTLGRYAFLQDPLFADEFRRVCERRQVVEYYLCSEPDGMLLVDAQGNLTLMLIPNDDYRLGQYEIAFDQGAPQELLEGLKRDDVLPYFWENGYWTPECRDWRARLYPATSFKGTRWYCYSLVYAPPPFKKKHVFAYKSFLDELDRRGRRVQLS